MLFHLHADATLEAALSEYGTVIGVRFLEDRATGKSKGVAARSLQRQRQRQKCKAEFAGCGCSWAVDAPEHARFWLWLLLTAAVLCCVVTLVPCNAHARFLDCQGFTTASLLQQ